MIDLRAPPDGPGNPSPGENGNGNGNGDVDAALVARAQRELPYQTRAYEALMKRHETLLYGVCRRMLNNEADAEDVCQDVMFKVFGALKRFEGRSSFKTWMLRIATNTCVSLIEKRRRAKETAAAWSREAEGELKTHMVTNGLDLETLLDMLTPVERQIVTLRYVADLSFQEIADVCGLGLSAAKMRLYRATEQLRALMQSDEDEAPPTDL